MVLAILNAYVWMVSVVNIASVISTNVLQIHVKTEQLAMISWIHLRVSAEVGFLVLIARRMIRIVLLAPVWMEEPALMVSTAIHACALEDFPDPTAKRNYLNATKNHAKMEELAKMFR